MQLLKVINQIYTEINNRINKNYENKFFPSLY